MRWDEMNNIEPMLETIWDLHDRLSDAIHSVSRSHFLNSIKTLESGPSPEAKRRAANGGGGAGIGGGADDHDGRGGFVFVKGFRVDDDGAAMAEARSLNAIRTALENLEDQLEFFHTVQSQQRAERDAALAKLKQSRIILALRLADHQGKKYKVIEEALRFVSDVRDEGRFVAPETLYEMPGSQPGGNMGDQETRPSPFIRMLISGFTLARNSLRWGRVGGVLGNAALFAVSMLALLQLHRVSFTTPRLQDHNLYRERTDESDSQLDVSSQMKHFDVFSARG
ncbi:plastid division protein PDV1 [Iris pallida]|uniref:Plastid division protein PDV1 n=1 Tax=Iris pallida TaxID=29817 RepID=A0AAX6I868_IRIPA|nr:plastid division protein PDV1 [Iris pallida]KAJ6849087.1 plastid division protein PDV1 [Iris pallida]